MKYSVFGAIDVKDQKVYDSLSVMRLQQVGEAHMFHFDARITSSF